MRNWARVAALVVASVALLSIVVAVVSERVALARTANQFPPPGELITFDGATSHIHCVGSGTHTVILESGLGWGGSQNWVEVQQHVSRSTRVCAYDRAGILWSEPRPGPRDAARIAAELHDLLAAAGEAPPYIGVGHSIGGIFIRVYDMHFPGEIVGFVFVDASHPEQLSRFPPEVLAFTDSVESNGPPVLAARFLSAVGLYRRRLSRPRTAIDAFRPRSIPWGYFGERTSRDATYRQGLATGSLGTRPLVVLTASVETPYPGVRPAVTEEFYQIWRDLQVEIAELSTSSKHEIVAGATHNIQLDRPSAVADAIIEVLGAVRAGEAAGAGSTRGAL